ncbi:MAG TPA: acyltransferase family protein [Stenotrophomonas sp.]
MSRAVIAGGRDGGIDSARAIAIVLVVLGHARGIPQGYTLLAFSFHVPLFFFLSGWVGAAYGRPRSDRDTWLQLARTLLVPYVCFFLVAYVYWLLTRHLGAKALRWGDRPWWEPLVGLLQGNGPGLYVQPALWFLPTLFVTAISFHYLRRWIAPVLLTVLAAGLACLWIAWFPARGVRLPWGLDVLPVSLFFFAAGAVIAVRRPAGSLGRAGRVLLPLFVAALWLPLAWLNGKVDINNLLFGHWPVAFLLAALLGTAMTMGAGQWIARWPGVQWIGRNTLLILCTHFLVFFVLSGVRSLLGARAEPGAGWALFVSVVALLAAVPMRACLMRLAPWMLGARHAPRSNPPSTAPEVHPQ